MILYCNQIKVEGRGIMNLIKMKGLKSFWALLLSFVFATTNAYAVETQYEMEERLSKMNVSELVAQAKELKQEALMLENMQESSQSPEKIKYAINRYTYEAERHYNILNDRLEKNEYMLGNTYTIVDMAVWGWTRMIEKVITVGELDKRKNLKRLMDYINARPASEKAENIAKINKHNFKIEIDEDASKHMFPQNERLK